MRSFSACCVILWFLSVSALPSYGDVSAEDIILKVAERVRQNIENYRDYGYYQSLTLTQRNGKGDITKAEKRIYRTIWVLDQPFHELLEVDDRDLNADEKDKESERLSEFVKAMSGKTKPAGIQGQLQAIRWWEIHDKYEFTRLPSEPGSPYVLSFQPRSVKLQERSRIERVLNCLTGTIWVDGDFNVVKAEARLMKRVSFGLGILAKIEEAKIQYAQQEYQNAWLPCWLRVVWKANIALLHKQRQEMQVSWHHPYPRPKEMIQSSVNKEGNGPLSTMR